MGIIEVLAIVSMFAMVGVIVAGFAVIIKAGRKGAQDDSIM